MDRIAQGIFMKYLVFVPFLGDFLSMAMETLIRFIAGFRPLSWGLSFNDEKFPTKAGNVTSFRPLSWGLSFNSNTVLP